MRPLLSVAIAVAVLPCVSIDVQVQENPQPQTHRLDLAAPDTVRTLPEHVLRETIVYVGKPTLDLPLHLRLLSIAPASDAGLPTVLYEVAITNVGETPFNLPWTVDRVPIEGGPRPFVEAILALQVVKDGEEPINLAQDVIVGHGSTKGSIKTLEPGDSAVIRVPQRVIIAPEMEEALTGVDTVRIRVVLRYNDGQRVDWKPLPSVNSQAIAFRRR